MNRVVLRNRIVSECEVVSMVVYKGQQFGGRRTFVRGVAKVYAHLIFGKAVPTVNQLTRLRPRC